MKNLLALALVLASLSVEAAPITGESVTFSWNANPDEITGYNFYERIGDAYYEFLGAVTDGTTAFTVANITAGTHRYVVTAFRSYPEASDAESGHSNEVTVTVAVNGSPPAVQDLRVDSEPPGQNETSSRPRATRPGGNGNRNAGSRRPAKKSKPAQGRTPP